MLRNLLLSALGAASIGAAVAHSTASADCPTFCPNGCSPCEMSPGNLTSTWTMYTATDDTGYSTTTGAQRVPSTSGNWAWGGGVRMTTYASGSSYHIPQARLKCRNNAGTIVTDQRMVGGAGQTIEFYCESGYYYLVGEQLIVMNHEVCPIQSSCAPLQ